MITSSFGVPPNPLMMLPKRKLAEGIPAPETIAAMKPKVIYILSFPSAKVNSILLYDAVSACFFFFLPAKSVFSILSSAA